jgi:hypothetical protein
MLATDARSDLLYMRFTYPTSTLTYGATVSVDTSSSGAFLMTATGNATLNASAGGTAGRTIIFVLTGDATGGRIITFGTNFDSKDTLVLSASDQSMISFVSDGTAWRETSRSPEIPVYTWR